MLWWTSVVLLCAAIVASEDGKSEWKEVTIEQGTVRGRRDSSGELWTFLDVPYATAPTGVNKFKAPLPPQKWTEPYDAINRSIICPQFELKLLLPENYKVQENCLIANLYVPNVERKDLSVLVYVHGGGFQIGYGDMLKMKNYMKYSSGMKIKPVPEGSTLPSWPAAGANGSLHMSLGQKLELRGALSEERVLFWDSIYQKYYKEPIPPPQPSPRPHTEL